MRCFPFSISPTCSNSDRFDLLRGGRADYVVMFYYGIKLVLVHNRNPFEYHLICLTMCGLTLHNCIIIWYNTTSQQVNCSIPTWKWGNCGHNMCTWSSECCFHSCAEIHPQTVEDTANSTLRLMPLDSYSAACLWLYNSQIGHTIYGANKYLMCLPSNLSSCWQTYKLADNLYVK